MATPPRKPKLSEQELELRTQKMEEAASCFKSLGEFRTKTKEGRSNLLQLENVALGLYDEIDKLTKKAPAEPITDLALEALNDIIKEAKDIASADAYVNRIKVFVPAGDNPQHRDAIIVLRQLRDGLKRYRESSDALLKKVDNLQPLARFLALALEAHIKKNNNLNDSEIEKIIQNYSLYSSRDNISRWLSSSGDERSLNLERIDQADITEYLSLN